MLSQPGAPTDGCFMPLSFGVICYIVIVIGTRRRKAKENMWKGKTREVQGEEQD